MATSTLMGTYATRSLLHCGTLDSSPSPFARSALRACCSVAAAQPGLGCAKELASQDMSWPLPCPTVNPNEPEGGEGHMQRPEGNPSAHRTAAEVGSHLNGGALSGMHSPPPSTPNGFEIRVGTASKATRFTPEKARLLRQKMRESDTHHDLMYHSGLAARLA